MARGRRITWGELARALEADHPRSDAAPWDNPGLQIGDPGRPARRALVALDPTPETVAQALAARADGLITHHPLIFAPLKSVRADRHPEATVAALLRGGLALLAMHTNLDVADDGPSAALARRLGLAGIRFLKATRRAVTCKIVTWLPEEALPRALDALAAAGAGVFGDYRRCAFSCAGEGEFTAAPHARPAAGEPGMRNRIPERRLETSCPEENLAAALSALRRAHPYEEPVIEAFRIEGGSASRGYGAVGELTAPAGLVEVAARVCSLLRIPGAPLVRGSGRAIRRVAVVSGSGASMIGDALDAGADLLITGDVKHHDAILARAAGLAMIDAGHFATEAPCRETLAALVAAASGGRVGTLVAHETDPIERFAAPPRGAARRMAKRNGEQA